MVGLASLMRMSCGPSCPTSMTLSARSMPYSANEPPAPIAEVVNIAMQVFISDSPASEMPWETSSELPMIRLEATRS